MDQVSTMYKISEILSQAFKQVNDVCAHYLADQTLANSSKQQKPVEKKQLTDKPHGNPVAKTESQPKKDHKVEVTQQKQKSQSVPQSSPSPRPTQQSKPKQVQKQQTQSQSKQDNKKAAAHPDKPKQPLSAFFLFTQEQKENVQNLHPKAGLTELTKMLGEIWRGLNESEKAPFIQKAEQLKVHYNKKLQKFYENHPEQKTKKQLKKEKRELKEQEEESSEQKVAVQKAPVVKPVKKQVILVEQQENSESV